MRDDGNLNQCGGSQGSEKYSDSGQVLKVELRRFDDRLYVECETIQRSQRRFQRLGPEELKTWHCYLLRKTARDTGFEGRDLEITLDISLR